MPLDVLVKESRPTLTDFKGRFVNCIKLFKIASSVVNASKPRSKTAEIENDTIKMVLWVHEKNCRKILVEKLVKMLGVFNNFDFPRKIVEKLLVEKLMKMLRFLTTLISREKLSKIFRVKNS